MYDVIYFCTDNDFNYYLTILFHIKKTIMSKELKYRIKEFKIKNNLTYEEIGNVCGRDRNTICNWTQIPQDSKFSMPYDVLLAMSKIFGCTIEQLHNERVPQTA